MDLLIIFPLLTSISYLIDFFGVDTVYNSGVFSREFSSHCSDRELVLATAQLSDFDTDHVLIDRL